MNEAYTYGGNGAERRYKYDLLSEETFGLKIIEMIDSVQALFLRGQSSPNVKYGYLPEDDQIQSSLGFSYMHLDNEVKDKTTDLDIDMLNNFRSNEVPIFFEDKISIDHLAYAHGSMRKQIIVEIHQKQCNSKDTFSKYYLFRYLANGRWEAEVEHEAPDALDPADITGMESDCKIPDDLLANDDFESNRRSMTSYDFEEFFKDINVIHAYLEKLLVQ